MSIQSEPALRLAENLFATADQCLLAPYALDVGKVQSVFGEIMTHSVDYADLYFQYSRSEGWSLEEGIVKSASFNIEQGVGVRAVSGDRTAFAYSDEISYDALQDAAIGEAAAVDNVGRNQVLHAVVGAIVIGEVVHEGVPIKFRRPPHRHDRIDDPPYIANEGRPQASFAAP